MERPELKKVYLDNAKIYGTEYKNIFLDEIWSKHNQGDEVSISEFTLGVFNSFFASIGVTTSKLIATKVNKHSIIVTKQ